MKNKIIWTSIILLSLIGCNSSNIRDAVKPGEDFKLMLINDLKDEVNANLISGGNTWGDDYRATYFIPIKDTGYINSDTYEICLKTLSKWKEKYNYGSNVVSAGGGDNYYEMRYKYGSREVFIDIISYKKEGKDIIQFIIRAH